MRSGKITSRDFAMITCLWLPHLIDAWLASWVELTIKIVFAPEDLNFGNLKTNKLVLFSMKCLLCLGLAIFVDVHSYLKYTVYFISLGVFTTTPVFALATIISKIPNLAYIIPWVSSSLFVTMPIKFCLIFNQRINSPFHQTRIIVAAFEFLKSVGTFVFIKMAKNYEDRNPMSLIGVWVFVQSLFVFFLTITDMARKSATKEPRKGYNLRGLVAGIRRDSIVQVGDNLAAARRKRLTKCQFSVFVVLLFPIVCVTVISVALPKVANGVGKHVLHSGPPYASYEVLINLLLIPAFGMGVAFLKKGYGTTADYVLVLAGHIFNTVVVIMIFLLLFEELLVPNYYELPPEKGSNFTTIQIINGTLPDDDSAVFYAIGNFGFSVRIPGSEHLGSKHNFFIFKAIPARKRHWFMRTWIDNHVLHRDFDINPRKRYMFQAISNNKTMLKLIQAFGAELMTPVTDPVLLVMNSIVGETNFGTEVYRDSRENWLRIKLSRNQTKDYLLPPSDQILRIVTKPGRQNLSLKSIPLNRTGTSFLSGFSFKNNHEYLVLVSAVSPLPLLTDITSGQTVSFTPCNVDITDKTEPSVKAMFALRGFTSAASTVGYLHFFWIESPIRLRTTLFAGFVVFNEIAAFIADEFITKIDKVETIVMLIISFTGLIVQFSFGLFYDCKLKKEHSSPFIDNTSKKSKAAIKKGRKK